MEEPQLSSALQAEYLQLQKTIEDFDARALTIKAWSVSFGLASIAGAFASHRAVVFLIAAFGALLFWFLETRWKVFQLAYYERAGLIERHFQGGARVEHPFQIGAAWHKAWSATTNAEATRMAVWPHVALPHAFVFVAGVLMFVLAWLSVIAP